MIKVKELSSLGIGSWQFSGNYKIDGVSDGHVPIARKEIENIFAFSKEVGIKVIDTAPIYGRGRSEKIIGENIKRSRNEWFLMTKFGMNCNDLGERKVIDKVEDILECFEGSLKRLQTDYVDGLLLHTALKKDKIESIVRLLEELKRIGKVKKIGLSTNDLKVIKEWSKYIKIDIVEFHYYYLKKEKVFDNILDIFKSYDYKPFLIVRGVLKNGLLSGKYLNKLANFDKRDFRYRCLKEKDFAIYNKKLNILKDILPIKCSFIDLAYGILLEEKKIDNLLIGGKRLQDYIEAFGSIKTMKKLKKKAKELLKESIEEL